MCSPKDIISRLRNRKVKAVFEDSKFLPKKIVCKNFRQYITSMVTSILEAISIVKNRIFKNPFLPFDSWVSGQFWPGRTNFQKFLTFTDLIFLSPIFLVTKTICQQTSTAKICWEKLLTPNGSFGLEQGYFWHPFRTSFCIFWAIFLSHIHFQMYFYGFSLCRN